MRIAIAGVLLGITSLASADWIGTVRPQLGAANLPTANATTSYYWLGNFQNRPGTAAAGTASVIRCGTNTAPGTGDSWTYVLEKSTDQGTSFSATSLTCTQTDTNLACGASSGSATVAGGDMLRIAATCATADTCASSPPSCGVTIE